MEHTTIKPCTFCKNNEYVTLFTNTDAISRDSFEIEQCKNCGLTRTKNIPEDLSPYYSSEYFGKKGIRFKSSIESLVTLFRKSRKRHVLSLLQNERTVFDFGCGRGVMLSLLKEDGCKVLGYDVDPEVSSYAEEKGVRVLHTSDELAAITEKFDVITSYHSLEHVADPVQTIKHFSQMVNDNGYVVIEVPNFESMQVVLAKGKAFHVDAPRHTYHFSLPILQQVLESEGFEITEVTHNSWEYGFFGMVQSLLNVFTNNMNVLYNYSKIESHRKHKLKMELVVSVLVLPFVATFSALAEFFGVVTGRGGVMRVTAKKTHSPNTQE